METMNKFLVGQQGNGTTVMNLLPLARMSKEDVLLLCAWLLVVSCQDTGDVEKVMAEIMSAG